MADEVMREMNNNLRKKEQENITFAMKGDFLAAGIKSEVEGVKSALTDVYKWVSCSNLIGRETLRGSIILKTFLCFLNSGFRV